MKLGRKISEVITLFWVVAIVYNIVEEIYVSRFPLTRD